jgi:hypothetical protein
MRRCVSRFSKQNQEIDLVARFAQAEGIRTLRNAQTKVDQFRHEPIHFG